MIAIGNFLFVYRNSLFPLTALLLFLPGPDLFADPMRAALFGAVLAALGQFVRVLTIGLDYIKRGGKQGRIFAYGLVSSGIYAHSRNPMYVGNITIVAGLALASNSWSTLLVALPLVLFAYAAIVAAEEEYLRGRFGAAYDEYCRTVPRWLPRLGALWSTFSGATFHWRRVIVKEYGTPAGWIAALCVVTLYNVWDRGTWSPGSPGVRAVLGVIAVTFAFWLCVRLLKKTKVLRPD